MSPNSPFLFGAGASQVAPAPSGQQLPLGVQAQSAASPATQNSMSPSAQAQAQQAFQQNAMMPPVDMSALKGISPDQLSLIAQLFQQGRLQLPPPPPSLLSPQVDSSTVAEMAMSSQVEQAAQEDVDMDKEEGEVEEGETNDTPETRDFLRPPPTGPRSSTPRTMKPPAQEQRRRQSSGASAVPSRVPNQHSSQQSGTGRDTAGTRPSRQDISKGFVLAMHHAGYSYNDMAKDVKSKALHHMFKRLGLPVPHEPVTTTDVYTNGAPLSELSSSNSTPIALRPEAPQAITVAKRPAPSKPAAKPNRSEYLAKLQAAKNKKTEAAATPQEPMEVPAVSVAPSPSTDKQVAVPTVQPATHSSPSSKAAKTELARQRLEAFKASIAAKANASSVPGASPSTPNVARTAESDKRMTATVELTGRDGSSDHVAVTEFQQAPSVSIRPTVLTQPQSMPNPPATISPTPSNAQHSFNGLPGLGSFGSKPVAQEAQALWLPPSRTTSQPLSCPQLDQYGLSAQTVQSPLTSATAASIPAQQAPVSRKRLATTDFNGASVLNKRPFGQSRSASEDEAFIIENSDDEDGDALMDIDEVNGSSALKPSKQLPSLRDFPPKAAPPASVRDTPGVATPGSATYEQKMKELEELKRKIAEKEMRAKGPSKVATSKTESSGPSAGLPGISASMVNGSLPSANARQEVSKTLLVNDHASATSYQPPQSTDGLSLNEQKENLRQRLHYLQRAKEAGYKSPEAAATSTAGVATDDSAKQSNTLDEPASKSSLQKENMLAAAAPTIDDAASEDGEVGDESDFDFYETEKSPVRNAVLEPEASVLAVPDHVDSQATTASATTEQNGGLGGPEIISADPPALDIVDEDTDMMIDANADDTSLQGDEAAAQQSASQGHGLMGSNFATAESQNELPTPESDDLEMQIDSSSDDSSDEDDGDLNTDAAEVLAEQPVAMPETNGNDELNDEEGEVESSAASSTSSEESDGYEPEPSSMSTSHAISAQPPIVLSTRQADDDLAPELQPSNAEADSLDQKSLPAAPQTYYKPYESPIMTFKDYRYHPQYLKNIPGGYQSRTYSHQIDPQKPLCQFETQGGKCNDKTCESQHFKSIGISDNVLLQQMGTEHLPVRTQEDRDRWNIGLQKLIKDLKGANVRDATTIAARIAEYRRDFVGDPTQVLYLG